MSNDTYKYDGQIRALSLALRHLVGAQESNLVRTLYDPSVVHLRAERGALLHVIDQLRGVLSAVEPREQLLAMQCRQGDRLAYYGPHADDVAATRAEPGAEAAAPDPEDPPQ